IRYAGTLVGNIANASPIADTPPFLFVMDAELELASKSKRRMVPITKFYKGYKDLDLHQDEVIAAVHLPLPAKDEIVRLYKVSRRIHLDISSFTAAFRLKINQDKIEQAAVALGGVGPVVIRATEVEKFLTGAPLTRDTFKKAGEIAAANIKPISDVRGSLDFRLRLSENIFQKLFFDLGKKEVCR
ncbi:FAD binding domain-containing protein, partial [bacterium]|nr:FAD binding domain-containing protein [bacterium]